MLVPNQIVTVLWNNTSKQHYIDLGYCYTKQHEPFEVKAEDLSHGSQIKVKVVCDYCGKEIIKPYVSYLREHDKMLGDCCLKCKKIKYEKTSLSKYGTKYPMQNKNVNNKRIKTNIDKYGFANPTENNDIKQKIIDTCNDKYGGCGYASEQLKKQSENTCLKKYHTKHPCKLKEVKMKGIATCQRKYGKDWYAQTDIAKKNNPMHRKDVQNKRTQTLYKNNKVPTSKAENMTCDLLKAIYGNDICHPSYPLLSFNMDCMLDFNDVKIDVEYDGYYWHQNKQKDRARDEIIKSKGYKVLRIEGNVEVPTKEQLIEAINKLRYTEHTFYSISLLKK